MRKLLSANFSRLWRSKIFWVLEALSAIAGAVFYILAIINTKNIGENWYLASGNYYFFIGLVIVGAMPVRVNLANFATDHRRKSWRLRECSRKQ